ncbi:MAG: hypothetical protein JSS39_18905 [Nitrospira sp.]|nr:hypothetical protein [Nitrospira sp.]
MATIFRALQESLCNVVKHANAKHAAITFGKPNKEEPNLSRRMAASDPKQFAHEDGRKRMGIVGMWERGWSVGATIKIIRKPGRGTTVVFSIPLSA